MSLINSAQKATDAQKSAYNPKEIEAKWTKYWFDHKLFDLKIVADKPKFSIALPPPNITGSLHMGHALNGTLQDVLIRLKRMQGYNVLWQPGTDHAGISTQMVVERELRKQGRNRRELGREAFVKEVWVWRNQYGNQILEQYKRLGVSFNWDRIAFTMDESYTRAIYRAFCLLYKEGYIYRGNRVSNWCPRCLTSLSDLEVEHKETKGQLYLIKYPVSNNGEEVITVATVRPESIFGDVAVAVHPDDGRYKRLHGRKARLPLTDRFLPVIQDDYVDQQFGTGALKVTPAHDANDWEIGQRHKLPMPVVIDSEGKMLANQYVPQQFQGKDRFEARELVAEELKAQGYLEEIRDYTHGVGYCERCHTVIEPYLSDQWYVAMKGLAEPAIKAVEDRQIVFVPERYAATYLDWMRNIRDWNISRQLWWGHRIPVWNCVNCKHQDAFETEPQACTKCGSTKLEQDEDVLDTWFSSALFPFATLGWPDETPVLREFYPTSLLSTAREIINLWVSRMIFTSLKFLKVVPFTEVLIHPVIQTPDGKRMSKSKGNAIDPLDMIEKYGTDANRFWFTSVGVKGDQDVRFREDKLEEYKKFVNKLWNAGRFVLTQLEGYEPTIIDLHKLTLADKWILHKYNVLLKNLHNNLDKYDFDDAARNFYEFIWDYFCDWYLEIAKIQITQEVENIQGQTRTVLYGIFESLLRALHPIMPFITEELWHRLPKSKVFTDLVSIMFAPYPQTEEHFLNDVAEQQMDLIIRVIRCIRNIRQTYNVPASSEAEVIIQTKNNVEEQTLRIGLDCIKRLAKIRQLSLTAEPVALPMAASEIVSSFKIYLPLGKLIDVGKTREKLLQRRNAIDKDVVRVQGILESQDFRSKAPKDKVESLQAQLSELENQRASVDSQLRVLESA